MTLARTCPSLNASNQAPCDASWPFTDVTGVLCLLSSAVTTHLQAAGTTRPRESLRGRTEKDGRKPQITFLCDECLKITFDTAYTTFFTMSRHSNTRIQDHNSFRRPGMARAASQETSRKGNFWKDNGEKENGDRGTCPVTQSSF